MSRNRTNIEKYVDLDTTYNCIYHPHTFSEALSVVNDAGVSSSSREDNENQLLQVEFPGRGNGSLLARQIKRTSLEKLIEGKDAESDSVPFFVVGNTLGLEDTTTERARQMNILAKVGVVLLRTSDPCLIRKFIRPRVLVLAVCLFTSVLDTAVFMMSGTIKDRSKQTSVFYRLGPSDNNPPPVPHPSPYGIYWRAYCYCSLGVLQVLLLGIVVIRWYNMKRKMTVDISILEDVCTFGLVVVGVSYVMFCIDNLLNLASLVGIFLSAVIIKDIQMKMNKLMMLLPSC